MSSYQPMSTFLDDFTSSLSSITPHQKEAMLSILYMSVLQDRKLSKCPPIPSNEDFQDLVKFDSEFLMDEVVLASLQTEVEELNLSNKHYKLQSGDKNPCKTYSLNSDYIGSSVHISDLNELPVVKTLLDNINEKFDGIGLDTCIVSCLRSSSSTVRLHADDEPDKIDQFSPICNVSLGSTRKLEFINKSDPGSDPIFSHDLNSGSLLTMASGCQQALKHRIRKATEFSEAPRYCLSFRRVSESVNNARLSPIKNTLDTSSYLHQSQMVLSPPDVTVTPHFLTESEVTKLLTDIKSLNFEPIGARSVFYAGLHDYSYSGATHKANIIPPPIKHIMAKLPCDKNAQVNSVVITKYRDGNDYLPAHSDNEKSICPWSNIFNVSLGETRKMIVKSLADKSVAHEYELTSGCLNVMSTEMQKLWTHEIPQDTSVCNERFSLTFRYIDSKFMVEENSLQQPSNTRVDDCLIAGDSISKGLDCNKLGKHKMKVLNISEGGNKIIDIEKSIETFVVENGHLYNIQKVFICCGANDIRYCRNGVGHLRNIIKKLVCKIKVYFPSAKIILQSLLPQAVTHMHVIKNVLEFNRMLYKACIEGEIYYMDVLRAFLNRDLRLRNGYLFGDAVHPNKAGLGRLARFYIYSIHYDKFNPLLKI